MSWKKIGPALLLTIILVGCGIFGADNSPGNGATPTPPLDTGNPDGVAQTFLNAWMAGDYTGMYSLLSSNSQREYTLQTFIDTYSAAAATMTLIDLKAEPLSVLSGSTDKSAEFRFRVTYNTQVLGPIPKELTMRLTYSDNRWGIVWSPDLIFPEMVAGNALQLEVQTPSRANIYDRNGLAFVTANASAVTISVIPGEISADFEDEMLNLLGRVLRMPPEQVRNNYSGLPADWKVALGDADSETVQEYWNQLNSYPGLRFDDKSGRRYFNVLAPHVMGYTSYIPEDSLEEYKALGYRGDEIVGLSGLEKWGETYLAGTRGGTLSAYTPSGEYFGEIASHDSVPAQSVYTTLDRRLQTIVQDSVEEAYRAGELTWAPTAGGAAVVVLDVQTGNVLAMASYPFFDPNVLNPLNNNPGATPTYLEDLVNNPLKPYLNRATQGQYPPGSVFKIVTTAATLDSGVLNPDSTYTCLGYWDGLGVENRRYDWKEDGHGLVDFRQALTASCNPFFYQAGLLTGQKDPMIIPSMARRFGFGQELGVQIEENSGLIPDPDWLQQTRGETWTVADSVNVAIGQGDVLVTPLQLATMVSAIANGGTVYRPNFVDHIGLIGETPSVTFQPEVIGTLDINPEYLAMIRESMRAVVSDPVYGTAEWRLGSLQMPVAGKTGTAQVSALNAPPIAWFAGFAPYDNPEIAVVVMIENGGQGSGVAAPIFRRIIERYYDLAVADWPQDWYDPEIFQFVKEDIGE